MVADALAPYVASSPAAMILAMQDTLVLTFHEEMLS